MESSRNDSNGNSLITEEEDEEAILEKIGTKVANAEKYEANVIRETAYRGAPRLGGIGFPDLSNLNTTNNGSSVVILETISARLAKEIAQLHDCETRDANVLRMKYQMLQSFLSTNDGSYKDINKMTEISAEKRRSAALKTAPPGKAVPSSKIHNSTVNASNTKVLFSSSTTPEQTLELAKKGLLPLLVDTDNRNTRNLSYLGKQALLDRQTSIYTKSIHQRQSMMERKRKLDEQAFENNCSRSSSGRNEKSKLLLASASSTATHENYYKHLIEPRKKRREERRQQKNYNNESNSSSHLSEQHQGDDNIIKEEEDPENGFPDGKSRSIDNSIIVTTHTIDEEIMPLEAAVITCPICDCTFQNISFANSDEFLSTHIDQCQRSNQQRRTTRSRKNTVNTIANFSKLEENNKRCYRGNNALRYDEFDDDVSENDVEYKPTTTALLRSRARTRAPKKEIPKAAVRSKKVAMDDNKNTTHRDDLELWEYEDRVDKWIECGILNMITLPEQNTLEVPPGKACFPGGLTIPAWMNNRLFAYQRAAVRWLWELHKQQSGSILGDEMGLGKTVQVASFLGAMIVSRKLDCILMIAPATLLNHWLRELTIWAPGLRRILVHKSGESHDGFSRDVSSTLLKKLDKWLAKARSEFYNEPLPPETDDGSTDTDEDEDSFCGNGYVVVTTYENLRKNADVWVNHRWSMVVIDEGQKIKNPDADVTLACKRLRTPHRVLITATPISNDLVELWSLFDFVCPGRLGTLPSFEAEFAEPIKRGGYANASTMQVQLAYRCALVLRDLVSPYLLRRQKKDIEEVQRLPGKTEHILFCRLSDRQRILYEAYLESDEMKRVLQGSSQCFKAITVLRKICNHPDLVCDEDEESFHANVTQRHNSKNSASSALSDDESTSTNEFDHGNTKTSMVESCGKLLVLANVLPLWKKQGHRVLIFCQWKKMLNILQKFMVNNGWKFARLDGSTNVGSRQALVDRFNNDSSYFAMLLTTRTGGVGLNLVGANRCILWDPDWNPQVDAQARERSYRFGQTKEVTIYRMITAGTIEEKIYHRQIFKTALSERVLQDPKQRRLFSQKDLKDLFTLRTDDKSGEKLSETAQLMKAKGVIKADDSTGDKTALGALMRSKGLACVFDHDVVEESSSYNKTRVDKEMEEKAKEAANRARIAVGRSATDQHLSNAFIPTWTGSAETRPSRFGTKKPYNFFCGTGNYEQDFGESMAAGLQTVSGEPVTMTSSAYILAKLRSQREQQS